MAEYKQRDIENQKYYITHITAMTEEDLRSKSDIAAELAHRDEIIVMLDRIIEEMPTCDLQFSNAVDHAAWNVWKNKYFNKDGELNVQGGTKNE